MAAMGHSFHCESLNPTRNSNESLRISDASVQLAATATNRLAAPQVFFVPFDYRGMANPRFTSA
jgi:hypothetical protein